MINKIIIAALACGIALSSCSSKFSLTKRRYTKGYHLEVAGKAKKPNQVLAQNPAPAKPLVNGPQHQIATGTEVIATARVNSEKTAAKNKTATPEKTRTSRLRPQKTGYLNQTGGLGTPKHGAGGKNFIGKNEDNDNAEQSMPPGTMMGSGDFMSALFYGFGSMLGLIIFYFVIFALFSGGGSSVVGPVIIGIFAIAIIALLVIGVLYLINAD